MTLKEIAARINEHLKRFENDPKINERRKIYGTLPYYYASARQSGRFVYITYVTFQGVSYLNRQQALKYLAWLDAGNVGTHYSMPKVTRAEEMQA